ncbi:MAG: outer membrane beta-barrel protein [Candidatus Cryptobacteroides sp.]
MKKLLLTILYLVCYSAVLSASERDIKVKGTALADMASAMEVLDHQAGIEIIDNAVYIDSRYRAAIYVSEREIKDVSHLRRMSASQIDSIMVIINPDSGYDKDINAIVKIIPVRDTGSGFRSETQLMVDITNTASMNVTQFIAWKKKWFDIDASFGFHDVDYLKEGTVFSQNYNPAPSGGGMILHNRATIDFVQNVRQRNFNGAVNLGFILAQNHRLHLRYEISTKPARYNFFNAKDRVLKVFEADAQGNIDSDNPISSVHQSIIFHVPHTGHELNLAYDSEVGSWKLSGYVKMKYELPTATVRMVQGETVPADIDFIRQAFQEKSMFSATYPFLGGKVAFGVADTYDWRNARFTNAASPDNDTHVHIDEHTAAVFASIDKEWEHWSLRGGIRYEYTASGYIAQDDDGTLIYLKSKGIDELKLKQKNHRVHPDASVSWSSGKSVLSLSYAQSIKPPYHDFARITRKDIDNPQTAILQSEWQYSTTLMWKYGKWLQMSLNHTYYRNPLFATIDDFYFFNGDNYHALNANILISPAISFWRPTLNVSLHKQWNNMLTANGVNNLSSPLVTIFWNNMFDLPKSWNIFLNMSYSSRGGNRNMRMYSPNFDVDASIQKSFWKDRVTLSFSANNILHTRGTDMTLYTRAERGTSDGVKIKFPRTFSISAIFRFSNK